MLHFFKKLTEKIFWSLVLLNVLSGLGGIGRAIVEARKPRPTYDN